MATMCINHPVKKAAAKCRQCQAGLCINCRQTMTDGGVYCSTACWQSFKDVQQRIIPDVGTRSRGKISILGSVRTLIIAAVLIAVIFGVMSFWLGSTDPGEWMTQLRKMFRVMMP